MCSSDLGDGGWGAAISSGGPALEIAAPQPPSPADQDKGVFSALKRIPDLLRPDPAPTGETPRPPMPVGTASPEIREFGN